MKDGGRRYHHGDLPAALVAAGLELARSGGGEAIGLREVTRVVGVTPNAAYRHFADRHALVLAVAARAQQELASAMATRMADADSEPDPGLRARRRLRAVGLAYISFAIDEPGWFRLAFFTPDRSTDADGATGHADAPPYRTLLAALDDLVVAGVLPADRRTNAEWACWSAVHGLSELATRGPLQGQPAGVVEQVAEYVVDCAIEGILAERAASDSDGSPDG
ncbi:TetR/AcrR family transcriptional regulator [Georgenia subflava]|uniref:TetR family transcriptional regulator n=1 Tax=Georgenia subflava TaxID=1622177 RepID=A0A6N7EHC8_9MICO|nr:TetR-like C-terminal domain-containing protein [Georgenia subflava]MPV36388.1 TetR family transcriptional regulator [Georgenia subflava]